MIKRFETFSVLINRISRNVRKLKKYGMKDYNLKGAHVSCLYHLYSHKNITATELCEKCDEDKATISRSVDFLEENGYLICESKSEKRYKSPLVLTAKGIEAAQKITEKIEIILEDISSALSEEERASFYRYLSIISERLGAAAKSNV